VQSDGGTLADASIPDPNIEGLVEISEQLDVILRYCEEVLDGDSLAELTHSCPRVVRWHQDSCDAITQIIADQPCLSLSSDKLDDMVADRRYRRGLLVWRGTHQEGYRGAAPTSKDIG